MGIILRYIWVFLWVLYHILLEFLWVEFQSRELAAFSYCGALVIWAVQASSFTTNGCIHTIPQLMVVSV